MPSDLDRLLDHPLAVDVVDALGPGPRTLAALRSALRGGRRDLDTALRVLAAHGLIRRRGCPGTWDRRGAGSASFELTGEGRRLAHCLEDVHVWVTIYEHYLHGR